jgi:hypothetical protein
MRSRLIIPLLTALVLIAAPAAASAVTIGISENSPGMFSDPLFQRLGVKFVRVVMSYNVMTSGDDEFARVSQYLAAAQAAGIEPLVTFEHARGDATLCNARRNFRRSVCRLPSAAEYERNVKAFLAAFPQVHVIAPWNEINHFTQPTSRSPKAAAGFTDIVRRDCPGCTIVAADVLDQADNPRVARPRFRKTIAYIKKFRRALKTKRTICGIHNYSDVNRFRATGTRTLIKALGCKQYWLTETGGVYKFGSFWSRKTRKGCRSPAACQLKATKYLFSLVKSNRKVKRVYVYTWFGAVTRRFDAGLVAHGKARPAYGEIAKRLRR